MPTPGEGLKHEREAQNKTLEEMAEATGIRLDYLAALEQDAYGALPGRGFGKLYIRAYAEVLGFDPRPIIQEYDRAMTARESSPEAIPGPQAPRPIEAAIARWRQERMAARQAGLEENEEDQEIEEEIEHEPGIEEPPAEEHEAPVEEEPEEDVEVAAAAEPEPVPPTATEMPRPASTMVEERRRSWTWPGAVAVLLVGVVVAALWVKGPEPEPPAPVESAQAPGEVQASPPPQPVAPAPAPPRAEPSHLSVTESAVGLRQVNGRVQEAGDRFRVGQRVVFATRVEGGRPGERIRHVWMRDGKLEQSIRLRLGSAHYRTFSTKTLGRPGAWAVEARAEDGQVLARAEMTAN